MTSDNSNYYWFQVNGAEYLAKYAALDAEAFGAMMLFMCVLCRVGSLPKDMRQLKIISRGAKPVSIRAALRCLELTATGYISKEIQASKGKVSELSLIRSEAGKQGAKKRWGHEELSDKQSLFPNGY